MVLPVDRLRELREEAELTAQDLAVFTGLSDAELDWLFANEYAEPTPLQLMTLSKKTNSSILWLLGYHAHRELELATGDTEIYIAISKRNVIESTLAKAVGSGIINGLIHNVAERRAHDANLAVAATAARIIAKQHFALGDREIKWLAGQPVYIEFSAQDACAWGISGGTYIMTEKGKLTLLGNGTDYNVFLTPSLR